MDYEKLKAEIRESCSPLIGAYEDSKKRLADTKKRLNDEKEKLLCLTERKEELTKLAEKSLTGSDGDYEKFKTALRKRNNEIETTKEAIKALESKVIPAQQNEVGNCKEKLGRGLMLFWKPHQQTCEAEMSELLDKVVLLQDDYASAFIETADFCGFDGKILLGVSEVYGSVLPMPHHPRIEGRSEGSIFIAEGRPKTAGKLKPPVQATPEAISQEIEAKNPSGEGCSGV